MRAVEQGTQNEIAELTALAETYYTNGQFDKAEAAYLKIVSLRPDWAGAKTNLATILQQQGKLAQSCELYKQALAIDPDSAETHNNLGITLKRLERLDEAVAEYRQALRLKPNYAEAHSNLGNVLKEQGEITEAKTHYEQALSLSPELAEAYYNYSEVLKFRPDNAIFKRLEALAVTMDPLPPEKRMYVHFALAKALDDTGDYDRAFKHMHEGNAIKRQSTRYDEAKVKDVIRQTTEIFTKDLFEHFRESGDPSPVPIFVLGMPRSGTTLIEQILASHPDVYGAGELSIMSKVGQSIAAYPASVSHLTVEDMQRLGKSYIQNLPALPAGKSRITDKRPLNFFYVGLIKLILPNARIIHVARNPADTCLSCFSKLFSDDMGFSYNLAELGRYYRYYHELMAHWRSVLPPGAMLDVRYEDVISNTEEQTRRLLDYCGLPWNEQCLRFHETSRNVITASAVQVRQPMFKSAVNRWQRYETHLRPLLDELPHEI